MTEYNLSTIEQAIADLQQGKMIILVDDEDRENEGDLVIAAEYATPEAINFMAQYARGLICLSMLPVDFERLSIPMMTRVNRAKHQTAFGVSIEAAEGISTGISAADRAHTIMTAINPNSSPKDIVMPGHMFPLRAEQHGVMVRCGHTEGSVDLARLAGLQPAGVVCEIMNPDGSMARLPDLMQFKEQHQLSIVTIRDLIAYRMQHENFVQEVSSAKLPVRNHGEFYIHTFVTTYDHMEHIALVRGTINPEEPVLVRLHSECLTGDVLGSNRCDCGQQLELSLKVISEQGGVLLYCRQEGRGIGLVNKIKAYALQDQGYDTVEANHQLGFRADERDYGLATQMLRSLGIQRVRLLTNNPRKIADLTRYGIEVVERVPVAVQQTCDNIHYLRTKRDKLGHLINI